MLGDEGLEPDLQLSQLHQDFVGHCLDMSIFQLLAVRPQARREHDQLGNSLIQLSHEGSVYDPGSDPDSLVQNAMKPPSIARPLLILALGLCSSICSPATAGVPDRKVEGHTVVSAHDPRAVIGLPGSAAYAGSDRWLLAEYADDIELHAFVDAGPDKRVRRIFWVQFEAYLPSRPELQHRYTSTRHVSLGGMDFYLDTWVEARDSVEKADSDGAHLRSVIRSAGYVLPESLISVRLVHLMDGSRKELMCIYSEDASATGFPAADLAPGGKAHDRWPDIEAAAIARAERSITFH
jgi:hypothetical protein